MSEEHAQKAWHRTMAILGEEKPWTQKVRIHVGGEVAGTHVVTVYGPDPEARDFIHDKAEVRRLLRESAEKVGWPQVEDLLRDPDWPQVQMTWAGEKLQGGVEGVDAGSGAAGPPPTEQPRTAPPKSLTESALPDRPPAAAAVAQRSEEATVHQLPSVQYQPEPAPDRPDHPDPEAFRRIGHEIGELVAKKNQAYGSSFHVAGPALRLLYPNGIAPEDYDNALALVRIWDKMKRIATDKDAFGESPFRDIGGYAVLGAELAERRKG